MSRVLLCLLLTGVSASVARAGEEAAPGASESSEPNWSLGAGVGFAIYSSTPITLMSGLEPGGTAAPLALEFGSVVAPSGSFLAERRLAGNLWLMGRVTLNQTNQTTNAKSATDGKNFYLSSTALTNVVLSLGLRNAFYATRRLHLSGFIVMEGGYQGWHGEGYPTSSPSDSSTVASISDASGYSLGVAAGFACDLFFLNNFALRVATPLLDAAYSSASGTDTVKGGPITDHTASRAFNGGLVFAPSFELRVLF